MELYPNWIEWKNSRSNTAAIRENKVQTPNYSFDNWLKMTKSFGDDVTSFVGQAKEKDRELDDEISKKKEEPKDKDDAGDSDASKDKETAWKKLKDIVKERKEKKDSKDKKS